LSVVSTEHKGLGLFSTQSVPANTTILRYCGEMIKSKECIQRYQSYDAHKLNYILTVKEIYDGGENPVTIVTNIDATLKGGVARYINHCCDPNLDVVMDREIAAFGTSDRPANLIGVPTFVTRRLILPGEELAFDYASSDLVKRDSDNIDRKGTCDSRVPCYCGANNCRGWLLNARINE
ncbi:unnamed protein product, partial [Ectocarpus fasciculatus]